MKATARCLAVALALICAPQHSFAQTSEPVVTHELRLRDGSRAYGRIEKVTDTEVVFQTASGVLLTASAEQIVSLRKVEGQVRNGEFQPADPNNTRLFFGPTGRSLPKG